MMTRGAIWMGEERIVCACCGREMPEDFVIGHICYYCGWQSDYVQEAYPDTNGGANDVSLNQARRSFKETGKSGAR